MEAFPVQGCEKVKVSRRQISGLSFLCAVSAFLRFSPSSTLVPASDEVLTSPDTFTLTVLRYLKTCKPIPHKRKENWRIISRVKLLPSILPFHWKEKTDSPYHIVFVPQCYLSGHHSPMIKQIMQETERVEEKHHKRKVGGKRENAVRVHEWHIFTWSWDAN